MHFENASVDFEPLLVEARAPVRLVARLGAVDRFGLLEPQAAIVIADVSAAAVRSRPTDRNRCLLRCVFIVSPSGLPAGAVTRARERRYDPAGNSSVSTTFTRLLPRIEHPVQMAPPKAASDWIGALRGDAPPGGGPMRILLVEDHEELAETVADVLRSEGMAVDLAADGQAALEHAGLYPYDVIVLDRDLPGVHGDDVCRRLVGDRSGSRVLMLTAAGSVEERVDGLQLGADDYLPKPFAFTELIARIRALCRRSGPPVPTVLACGDLRVDPARRTASRGGRPLALSPKEFAVLEHLMAVDGRLVTAEELLQRVWDEHADPFTATVKVTIARLRGKLGDPPLIENVREGGYRIPTA
jgi:DNA-binding response OmpR family regulator